MGLPRRRFIMRFNIVFLILMLTSPVIIALNCSEVRYVSSISDAFTIGSTYSQTFLGVGQVLLAGSAFLANFIFYKKGDTERVARLRNELNEEKNKHSKLRSHEPELGLKIFNETVKYINDEESDIKTDTELLEYIKFIKELLAKRTEDDYSSEIEEEMTEED
jgi:hypothetical protein